MAAGILSTLLLVAGVALMVLIQVLVVVWVLRRGFSESRRLSRVGLRADQEAGDAGLTEEEVGELPCHDFKAELAGEEGGDCAVCLEALRDGERCVALPRCGHGFHAECVGSWLRKSRLCPVCRAEVAAGPRKDQAGADDTEAAMEVV